MRLLAEKLLVDLCKEAEAICLEIESVCEDGSHPGVPQTENNEVRKLAKKLRAKCRKALKTL